VTAAVLLVLLAARSPAYPIALAGLPPALLVLGPNPLPDGAIVGIVAGSIALSLLASIVLRGEIPSARAALSVPVLASILLLVLLVLRLPSSPALGLGTDKIQLFAVQNVLLVIAGVFVGWRHSHVRALLLTFLGVAVIGAVVLLLQQVSGNAQAALPDRFAFSAEADPIQLGRMSALGVVIAVYLVLSRESATLRLLAAGCIPVLAVALFGSGSRGPVLALVVGVAVLLALGVASGATRGPLLTVIAAGLAAVVLVPHVVPQSSISRAVSFATSDVEEASNGRIAQWDLAYEAFTQEPWTGLGTGEFAALRLAADYPHNLFLEAAAELGVPGLALVLALLLAAGVALSRLWRRSAGEDRLLAAALLALFITALVNALVSGALPHNHLLWLWAGVGAAMAVRRQNAAQPA
jgi:O-antigen ligase